MNQGRNIGEKPSIAVSRGPAPRGGISAKTKADKSAMPRSILRSSLLRRVDKLRVNARYAFSKGVGMQTLTTAKKLRGRRFETRNQGNEYRSTDPSQPGIRLVAFIRHITKCDKKDSTGDFLVGAEILEKQTMGRNSNAVAFQSGNGDRRLGLERRCFSYDAHMPERRSGAIRRNIVDRRDGLLRPTN